ncbi:MAG: hypothetical protein MUE42_10450 [Opitutaceae bacterium]|nr:hypothetical protein [Opitutaceae bacterium]
MSEELWLTALRVAGALHFATLAASWFAPVPRDWDGGLARLSPLHRRLALAQNAAAGAVSLFFGYASLAHAPAFLTGGEAGRLLAAGAALWWAGRLAALAWLRAWDEAGGRWMRAGLALLHAQCAVFAAGYGWLALGR